MSGETQKSAERAVNSRGGSVAIAVGANDEVRNELFSAAVTALGDVAYRWNIQDDLIHWADGVSMLLGVESAECVGTDRSFGSRVVCQKGASRYEAVMRSRETDGGAGVPYDLEYQVKDDFGGLRWVEDRGRWFANADGTPGFAVGVLRSIEARRSRDDRLVRLSTYDELTGLLNRVRLKESVEDVLKQVQRGRNSAAFLLLAIDNLTLINDSYGFDVADEVIVGVGQRLRGLARRVDAVGRYSGNKFGLVLRNCSKERLISVTERLLASVRDQVIETSRGPVATTISAGCISLPAHAQTVEQALGRAEEALTVAKQMHRDSYVIYTPSREREKTRQHNINVTDELVSALNDKRICLAYQPVVSSVTGEVMMHECLIRLEQPDGSIAAAGNFVPIAEKLGLIGLLDFRAMELTMETLRAYPDVKLSLNVSGRTTSDRMWLDTLVAQLRADRSLASRLVVEITETVALQEIEGSAEFVRILRELGCQVAIDDFGAGYTSFRNLKTIEVDLVKIDGSFVQDLVSNQDNQFFVRTLVELAHNFNLPIIAEWVGNAEEVAMLRDFGVQYLQGFFLGEPVLELPRDRHFVALTGTRY
ncbi:MAG: GGDEF and EAL domain-containing protein [Parvibaculum sp.]|uniref:putative bifunctional diguanylate cyclase/phosphodiesterase n=1 Tax=Parvibaculum sp. TaxID=2024848 RepID=UPI002845E17D|nr:GGDEF and EAL domain-containing protein [Parvibaculum sp.]MDR3500286.1 GGDEF and EAL domain-containing protein [Parvibaculum sp.]